jgi:hypothetical protein
MEVPVPLLGQKVHIIKPKMPESHCWASAGRGSPWRQLGLGRFVGLGNW